MASQSSRNLHPYNEEYRFWKTEADIGADKLSDALTTVWLTLPYDDVTPKYHNPPLRKVQDDHPLQHIGYIPEHLCEPVRLAACILNLYQHLAVRVPWIDLQGQASSANQSALVAWVHQMYSGLRLNGLNVYVAQKVMEHISAKILEFAHDAHVHTTGNAAPQHRFTPSYHIPALAQFLFEQITFGTSCPEIIDVPNEHFTTGPGGCRYFPDPITGRWQMPLLHALNLANPCLLKLKNRVDKGDKHAVYLRRVRTWDDEDINTADDGYNVYFAEAVEGIIAMFQAFAMQDADTLNGLVNEYPAGPGNPELEPTGPETLLVPPRRGDGSHKMPVVDTTETLLEPDAAESEGWGSICQ
ncbi:hypothetical protein C8Q77DRAFT_1055354 [Trametes polyzona]|nr:hypothetical protein C8Q77DRAFT_1055635 [Trametes polyzona]KAI0633918.1 hypothetical protein C8Q77DRAFT_1055354 [Trametes polyzona]